MDFEEKAQFVGCCLGAGFFVWLDIVIWLNECGYVAALLTFGLIWCLGVCVYGILDAVGFLDDIYNNNPYSAP